MDERKPDTVIAIPVSEYRDLIIASIKSEDWEHKYWAVQHELSLLKAATEKRIDKNMEARK